jgi:hypothetical protein
MTTKRCFQCEKENPPEQTFCGHCGASLVLKDYITAQVSKAVAESPRDRESLIKADAVEVFEKAWGWAKLTAEILLIPVLAVVTLLGWLGWREFNLSKAAANAQQQIKGTANKARGDISQASAKSISDVQQESGKAIEANHISSANAAKLTQDLNNTASQTKGELKSEASDVRAEVSKSKLELQEVHKLQPEFDTMRSQLTKAASDLAAQQKVISSSEDFVKHVFSSHVTYIFTFPTLVQPNHSVALPLQQGGKNSVILMLLPNTPINGTLQLQWGIFVEPLTAYFSFHNLMVFFFPDKPTYLADTPLLVSLFPDTGDKKLFKTLEMKDGIAYIDGQPLPNVDHPDPAWDLRMLPQPKE